MYDMALLKNLRKLGTLAPTAWPAFQAFDRAAMADGAVPVKYKELMAVAVALTTQCPYCIEAHTKRARTAGATAVPDVRIRLGARARTPLRARGRAPVVRVGTRP